MKTFDYIRAETVAEASETLCHENAVLLAGGTDLLDVLRNRLLPAYPEKVVSLKRVKGLDGIKEENGCLRIGAMATLASIADSPLVREKSPMLAQAAASIAAPNLRNTATLGGNLCQNVRCWYYRYPDSIGGAVNCARKEGSLCSAMSGENRYHSIFGGAKVCTTPCSSGCPAGTDIPAYMEQLRAGDLDAAARILLGANPMPAITSRVCAHFCQEQCNRNSLDENLNIGSVERYLGDYILQHHERFMKAPAAENGKHVSIIGTGPAGLAAAYYLRQSGCRVTMYERMPEAGGCLAYAIPAYRLPKEVVRSFVTVLAGIGIRFVLNTHIGADVQLEEIHKNSDSLLLDTGTWKRPLIGISGEELTRFGLDFLVDVNSYIHDRPGAEVVVVGGGNVAVDVAVTAKRLGAPKVTMVCLEPRDRMPANSEEIGRVLEEGIEIRNGWGPERIIKEDGKVRGVTFKACPQVFDEAGRFAPVYDESKLETIRADVVFMAIGQKADLSFLDGVCAVETERGRIKALESNSTSVPGIFAGGDVTTGPATVVQAIAAGKNAAIMMNRYMGGSPLPVENDTVPESKLLRFDPACQGCSAANKPELLRTELREIDKEDEAGFTPEQLHAEASRCQNCGCLAVNPSDMENALLAADAVIRTNLRELTAEELFTAHARITDTLKPGEIVLETIVPLHKSGTVAKYDKFRLRQSIDFAVVALACSYTVENGVVSDARIVLGAVAPIPLRRREAEQYLIGRELSAETARQTAELALQGALPLANNAYKIDIAKTMVERFFD